MKRLTGRRVLVVGASSGIGRAVAARAAEEGACLALAARRAQSLAEIAASLPGTAVAAPLDVRDPASIDAGVAAAVAGLGGLDSLVYAVGMAFLRPLAEMEAPAWNEIFETNVTGAALVTRAALPHLTRARGRAIFLSSISADDRPPRQALGGYMVSKAALNKLVEVWQAENHAVSFTRLSVGDTASTDFARDWDLGAGGHFVQAWNEQGVMFGRTMEPASVGLHVADLLAAPEAVSESRIVPRYRVPDDT